MAFEDQERVLLRLTFDAGFRHAFLDDPELALRGVALTEDERLDFVGLSRVGLRVDARDREALVVGRLCRSYPLTVSVLSAHAPGLACVSPLADTRLFESLVHTRPSLFGEGLLLLVTQHVPAGPEQRLALALAKWEQSLAKAAGELRARALAGQEVPVPAAPPDAEWLSAALALAPFVVAAQLPASIAELTRRLCPCPPEQLYARLRSAPLPRERLSEVAHAQGEGRLMLGRAVLTEASGCDATVIHQLMEASPGFAPLLAHLDGRQSANTLLAGLARAGAPASVLDGFRRGLEQMLQQGFVKILAARP